MRGHTDLLQLLLQRTKDGMISWSKEEPEIYVGRALDYKFQIHFEHPMVNDGTTSGRDIVHVTIGRLIQTFTSGTEGMDLVLQTLEEGLSEWREHLRHVEALAAEAREVLVSLEPK